MGDNLIPSSSAPYAAINVTEDGGVKRLVVQGGLGEAPPLHSRCLVHYVGRIAESGEIFMDTRNESTMAEPVQLVAGRDSLLRDSGIHQAVAKMHVGERCHVWVTPEYGYGSSGNFSFPTIPPNAHLTYDVELLDFEPPVDDKEQRDMTYEERLEAAERRRAEGNAAFKDGRYKEALSRYSASISFIDEDLLMQLHGFHYDKAMETRLPALLNVAACHLKLGDYHSAISASSQALTHDRNNAKALFRRGSARLALGQTESAIADLQASRKAAPQDAGIAKELAAALEAVKEERKAQQEVFKGVLAKTKNNEGGRVQGSSLSNARARGGMGSSMVSPAASFLNWLSSLVEALYLYVFGKKKDHAE